MLEQRVNPISYNQSREADERLVLFDLKILYPNFVKAVSILICFRAMQNTTHKLDEGDSFIRRGTETRPEFLFFSITAFLFRSAVFLYIRIKNAH